jgi:hypothetical protein
MLSTVQQSLNLQTVHIELHFHRSHLLPALSHTPAHVPKRVVVHVLDSGVDLSHPVLKGCGGSISLVWSGFQHHSDEDGHGTMVRANRMPNADIGVLKVGNTKGMHIPSSTKCLGRPSSYTCYNRTLRIDKG